MIAESKTNRAVTDTEVKTYTVAIAGNPNCGKTTLFNGLTGSNQRIGNWPGVTVEKKEGEYSYKKKLIRIVDLPGIYSLSAHSEDEKVARSYVLSGEADIVINILDATNLERNLYLTTQLLEMKVPMVIVLNMMDLANKKNIEIDVEHFERHMGCPVVPISAVKREDVEKVKAALDVLIEKRCVPETVVEYSNEIESAITELAPLLVEVSAKLGANPRWTAVKLIEDDGWVVEKVVAGTPLTKDRLHNLRVHLEKMLGEESDILVADYRYGFTHGIVKDVVRRRKEERPLTEKIDRIVLSRVFGIPIFLLSMYLVFWVTINLGGAFVDFFDLLFGTIFVDGFGALLAAVGSPDWLTTVLAGGLGTGIQTVSTFIPIIFFMFFMLSILEDSGYMARAAFVMDRFMRWIGLPGKAFVPLLLGFGCTVPAIMATRTLENKKDRILTVLISPFMSCGARLPVYALFAAAFFPRAGQNIIFSLYMVGIIAAVITGLLLKNTVFRGEPTPFVMELPPYHSPRIRHIMFHTWNRLKLFLFRAGKVIVGAVIVLSFLSSLGVDGTFGNENSAKSVLAQIGRKITPVFAPFGVRRDNWPASVALFTGVFAKEAIVGTVNSLYGQIDMAESGQAQLNERTNLKKGVRSAFLSVPLNLKIIGESFVNPAGIQVGREIQSEQTASQALDIKMGIFSSMRRRFDGPAGAYAYLLFVLLYIPCIASLGAASREIGGGLTAFMAVYLVTVAWVAATLFYQVVRGHQFLWIGIALGITASVIFTLITVGLRPNKQN